MEPKSTDSPQPTKHSLDSIHSTVPTQLLGRIATVLGSFMSFEGIDLSTMQVLGQRQEDSVIIELNAANADIVFVAMGSPKQELWISEHKDQISASVFMGIGGTLDVVSGRVKLAPAFFRKTGTEWLYRLITEPKRWKRQLALPGFLILLVRYKLGLIETS